MSKPIIRYMRFHCTTSTSTSTSRPIPHHDGTLAVAAINEDAQLAQLLLVDMRRWGRNDGAAVSEALGVLVPAAHRRLVAGFGISLADTLLVEWDGEGTFFMLRVDTALGRPDDAPACTVRSGIQGEQSSFLRWWGPSGAAMLQKVEAVVGGVWAGVEG